MLQQGHFDCADGYLLCDFAQRYEEGGRWVNPDPVGFFGFFNLSPGQASSFHSRPRMASISWAGAM